MLSFILSGTGCAFAALCYAEFAAMIPLAGSAYTYAYATLGELFAWIIGWDLTLEYAMGASTVSSGWSNHFIELLEIFHLRMPLWLAYDHWTGLRIAEGTIARQMAQASDSSLVPGTQAFLARVADIMTAQSPELVERGHQLLNAPHLFGMEIGVNVPAFLIALVITAILAVGIRESARFNSGIVVIKVSVVLFVIGLGFKYVNYFIESGVLTRSKVTRMAEAELAADLFVALLDELNIQKAIVVGISAGGLTALEIAANYPDQDSDKREEPRETS